MCSELTGKPQAEETEVESEWLKTTSEGQVEPGKEVVTPLPPQVFHLQPPRSCMPEGAVCAVGFEDQKGDEMWVHAGRGLAGQKSK